jgi:hypothetical protein
LLGECDSNLIRDNVRVHVVALNPELCEPYALIFISRRRSTKLVNVPHQLKCFSLKRQVHLCLPFR